MNKNKIKKPKNFDILIKNKAWTLFPTNNYYATMWLRRTLNIKNSKLKHHWFNPIEISGSYTRIVLKQNKFSKKLPLKGIEPGTVGFWFHAFPTNLESIIGGIFNSTFVYASIDFWT